MRMRMRMTMMMMMMMMMMMRRRRRRIIITDGSYTCYLEILGHGYAYFGDPGMPSVGNDSC